MKRKLFLTLIMLFTLAAFTFGLVACDDDEPEHVHEYAETVIEPTCTEQGYTVYTCDCGYSYTDNYVDAIGHEFTDYVSDHNAYYNSDGTKTAVCNHGCGATHTVEREIGDLINKDNFNFPIMYVNTENEAAITSKEEYVKCEISITNTEEEYKLIAAAAGIRGRGNTTWNMPKKPYRIKFDKKTNLFGFGKAKSWALIANYGDQSFLRNALAYETGRLLGEDYTTETQFINVYLNGTYQGLYLLCEQTEVGSSRVNVSDDLSTVDTGYLIELDHKLNKNTALENEYFMIGKTPYCIKDPDADDDDFTQAHYEFIKDYVTAAFNAADGDYADVETYFDVSSWVNCYIVHELFHCCDVGNTSFFMYKDTGGKLCCGPLWDFDVSSGNCSYGEAVARNDGLYAAAASQWYKKLLQHDEFKAAVVARLNEKYQEIEDRIDALCEQYAANAYDFETNFIKWDILGIAVWPNTAEIGALDTWAKHVEYLKTWLTGSMEYLLSVYSV